MEKLVYCLWRPEEIGREERLRGEVASALEREGVRDLRVFVADEAVDAGAALRLSAQDSHKEGCLSYWLECSQDRAAGEAIITRLTDRLAGYLVVESRPLVPPVPQAGPGLRSPGWVQVTGIVPRADLDHEAFLRHWYDVHRKVACETQSSSGYVRNEIVRPLTSGAPPWAAIVEETFPTAALDDPQAFYDAVGSDERFRENMGRMIESVQAFLAIDQVDAHPMSEYVFRGDR